MTVLYSHECTRQSRLVTLLHMHLAKFCVCLSILSFLYCVIHPAHQPNLYRQLTKCCMQKAAVFAFSCEIFFLWSGETTQSGFQLCSVATGSSQKFPCSSKSIFSKERHYKDIRKTGLHTLNFKKVTDNVLCFKCWIQGGLWLKPMGAGHYCTHPPPPALPHSFSHLLFFLLVSLSLLIDIQRMSGDEDMCRCWPCVLGVKGIIHVYFILLLLCGIPVKSPLQE